MSDEFLDTDDLTTLLVLLDEDRKQPARTTKPPMDYGCLSICFIISAIVYFIWLYLS